jgi:peptidoglycan hydrolase CwlO-like protein
MRRIISIALVLSGLTLFSACGKTVQDENINTQKEPEGQTVNTTTDQTASVIDAAKEDGKKPKLPEKAVADETSDPDESDTPQKDIEADVKSILHDISNEEKAAPTDNTAEQPTAPDQATQ